MRVTPRRNALAYLDRLPGKKKGGAKFVRGKPLYLFHINEARSTSPFLFFDFPLSSVSSIRQKSTILK